MSADILQHLGETRAILQASLHEATKHRAEQDRAMDLAKRVLADLEAAAAEITRLRELAFRQECGAEQQHVGPITPPPPKPWTAADDEIPF
jgi:hypothetical protein